LRHRKQGCQTVYFQTKIQIWIKILEGLTIEDVVIGILCPFGTFYSNLVYCMVIWYTLTRFDILWQENLATPITSLLAFEGGSYYSSYEIVEIFVDFQ
jgi:hypothetical protein